MTCLQPGTRVYLFGQFCLQHSDHVYQHFESSKALELFCYLLVNRGNPQPREVLSALLWGDSSAARSKKNLRQVLWQLQGILRASVIPDTPAAGSSSAAGSSPAAGTDAAAACPILDIDHAWVRINEQAGLWIDVEQFEHAYTAFHAHSGLNLSDSDAQCLKEAVQLYQGDLLEGWYQDWCLFERERMQNMFFEMLEKLMAYSEMHRQYDEGIDHGARILRIDRARERTYRSLMRLNFLAGDRTEALRQYERCEAALREELGVEPSQSTKDLRLQILNENVRPPVAPPAVPQGMIPIPVTGHDREAIELVDELRQLLATLAETQARLEEKLLQIEKLVASQA